MGATGLFAQWAMIDEATYGVAPAFSAAQWYANTTDSLGLAKVPKQSAGIFSGSQFERAARRVGAMEYSVKGNRVYDLPERGMNKRLFHMFGSFGQAAATLAQDGSTGAYKSVHAPGFIDGHTFALQKGVPGVDGTVVPMTMTGCKVQSWQLDCALSDIVKITETIEGRNELAFSFKDPLNGSVPSLAAYTAPVGNVFRWVGASVYVGGTPSTTAGVTTLASPTLAGNVTGPLMFKWDRTLDLTRYAPDVAPFRNEPMQIGVSKATGQLGVEFVSSETYYASFQNDTPTSIEYQFETVPIGTGSDIATFSILVPNIRIETAPLPIAGPGIVKQSIAWTGLDDSVNNVVQGTYVTLDSA